MRSIKRSFQGVVYSIISYFQAELLIFFSRLSNGEELIKIFHRPEEREESDIV